MSDNVKMPRSLYTSADIREVFDYEYNTVLKVLQGYRSYATVKNDWGVWYHLKLVNGTAARAERVQVTKAKVGKDGQPIERF